MKSLKEISKNIIPLAESVFDMEGEGRLAKNVDKDVNDLFLKSCKGNFTTVAFKDGSVRINGKLIISRSELETIPLNCRDFHGKLVIENCPKLRTLEGCFLSKIIVFDGSITINQCPSLETLDGIPDMVKGDVSITNCPKLKSFGSLRDVLGNLYWERNGKKFTKEQIEQTISVIKSIHCSVEDEEANVTEGFVNEAFNNQWMQRLATQLKKYPWEEYDWQINGGKDKVKKYNKIDNIFYEFGRTSGVYKRLLDKISNEDIDVYSMEDKDEKDELIKLFWKVCTNQDRTNQDRSGVDLILIYDESLGEFVKGYGGIYKPRGKHSEGIKVFAIPNSKYKLSSKMSDRYYTKQEAKADISSYGIGYTAVVINGESDYQARWDLHNEREKSRADMINPGDVEQYKKIAQENIKRYKDIIAQNHAKKSLENKEYDQLNDEFESIMNRMIKLVKAVAKDPGSYKRWNITSFLQWMRDEQRWNPNYKSWKKDSGPAYYGDYGLMYRYKEFMSEYLSCFGERSSYSGNISDYDLDNLKNAAAKLKEALEKADEELKKFGV